MLINLFTGEIVETFNKNKEKGEQKYLKLLNLLESSLTSEQKEWLHIKNSIYKLMPKGKVTETILNKIFISRKNSNKVQLISINYSAFFINSKKRK